VDGASIVPLLRSGGQSANWRRNELFWHYPHYHTQGATPYSAVRRGDWRLIEFQEDGRTELYDLKQDPEEKRNLAAEAPQRTRDLLDRLRAWRQEVGAQAAVPNPNYDSNRLNQKRVNPAARE
jgi:arylsulfatase A-like enzyme